MASVTQKRESNNTSEKNLRREGGPGPPLATPLSQVQINSKLNEKNLMTTY